MNQIKHIFFSLFFLSFFLACNNESEKGENDMDGSILLKDTALNEFETALQESRNYLKNRDLDGDGKNDNILFEYTGGGHCCYKMSLCLSSRNDTVSFPFEMDGGYEFGIVDGSSPDQFKIDDFDNDGRSEIFMQINTYNGEEYQIPKDMTEEYGIRTNYIIFDFREGGIILEDFDKNRDIK